ncbi:MAG: hypothetical protein Q8R28_11640, partial [Dehalococcoidia bacterium]|nr:hypothetical protein [Dehalococcoidia bacterium]
TEEYDAAALAGAWRPERVRIWYQAGFQSPRTARPMVEMDLAMERIIVLYSATLLDRGLCTCNNVVEFMKRWTEDRALVAADGSRYQFQSGQDQNLTSPWGTTAGALWAWKQTERIALGRAVKW